MYILLILFFASLCSIIFMIGRKLVFLKHEQVEQVSNQGEVLFELPYLKEVKHITIANIKKHGYDGLVAIIRVYVRSTNFLKDRYQEIKNKIKNLNNKNMVSSGNREISKFLKIIGEYKQKIREIKHKIKKEEDL